MFLREFHREKDGKDHRYWALCESVRTPEGPRQRIVCYLGDLNASLEARWRKTIQVFNAEGDAQQLSLFPAEAVPPTVSDPTILPIRLDRFQWERPRQLGPGWVAWTLWQRLGLDTFWTARLAGERAAIPWATVAALLAIHRLCAPGSELALAERWVATTALDDLLGFDDTQITKDRLYRCLDRLLPHKTALEGHLKRRYGTLFGATFDVLLYDLTSTYFEGLATAIPRARRGYSRDHRPDCKQVLIALVVNVEGFPVAYEIFPGNRPDHTTLPAMLRLVERKYGRARRIWVFDRGIASEANLAALRARTPLTPYLVGTPKRGLKAVEHALMAGEWQAVRDDVDVKCVPTPDGQETWVLARSRGRQAKERAMREAACARLERALTKLAAQVATGRLKHRDKILERKGAVFARHPSVARLYAVTVTTTAGRVTLQWEPRADRRQAAELREGAYLLRAFGCDTTDPAQLWTMYIQLTEAEAAFKALKSELQVRPLWHRKAKRVEAHILVAFLGYALWVALKHTLKGAGSALSPNRALEALTTIMSGDFLFETATGQTLRLRRASRPTMEQATLLNQLKVLLPERVGVDVKM